MAVTSIWPVKGRVSKVIEYARNPEKTTEYSELSALHAVGDVIEYAADEIKTERRAYVTGINCDESHAIEQFIRTKQFWARPRGGCATTAISPSRRMRSRRRQPMRLA